MSDVKTQCCERDHNHDGNCDVHSTPGVLRREEKIKLGPALQKAVDETREAIVTASLARYPRQSLLDESLDNLITAFTAELKEQQRFHDSAVKSLHVQLEAAQLAAKKSESGFVLLKECFKDSEAEIETLKASREACMVQEKTSRNEANSLRGMLKAKTKELEASQHRETLANKFRERLLVEKHNPLKDKYAVLFDALQQARQQRDQAQAACSEMRLALGMGHAWSLLEILKSLVGAQKHLQEIHDCDCQNWEGPSEAVKQALRLIPVIERAQQSDCGTDFKSAAEYAALEAKLVAVALELGDTTRDPAETASILKAENVALTAKLAEAEACCAALREFVSVTPVNPLNDWFKRRDELLSTTCGQSIIGERERFRLILTTLLTLDRWTCDVITGLLVQDKDGPWVMIDHKAIEKALSLAPEDAK